jgi:hypothetical protein
MSYPIPEIKHRYSIRNYILTLDPVKDHQQICFLSSCYDFPWDFTRSLELALFRLFKRCIVTIEILPEQSSYTGSTHNGVTSADYAFWYGSFAFIY